MVTHDLIGLTRAWAARPGDGSGTVDCCLLAAEVHRRLGYHDYTPDLAFVFEQYTDDSLPSTFILRWLLRNGTRLDGPEPHAVVFLPGAMHGAMGTVLDDGQVLYISEHSGVVIAPLPPSIGHFFRLHK
jgi:hypothetical protein